MQLNLDRVAISNFLSFGEGIEISLRNRGLCLVKGLNYDGQKSQSNMTGKSAFFDFIVWMLFGKPFRKLIGKDIIRDGQDECKGDLYFGAEYHLHRAVSKRNPNWLSFQNQSISQEQLEKELLGITFQQFVSTIFFGDETSNKDEPLFAERTNAEKFAMVTPILDNALWSKGRENASNKVKGLQEELFTVKCQLQEVIVRLDQIPREVEIHKDSHESVTRQRTFYSENKEAEKRNLQEQISELKNKFQQFREQPMAMVSKDSLDKQITETKNREVSHKDSKSERAYHRDEYAKQLTEISNRYAVTAAELKQRQQMLLKPYCFWCKQEIKGKVKSGLQDEVHEFEKAIRGIESEKSYTDNLKKEAENDILQLETLIDQAQKTMTDLRDKKGKREQWEKDVKQLSEQIQGREKDIQTVDDQKDEQLKLLDEEAKKHSDAMTKLLLEQNNLEKEKSKLQKQVERFDFEIRHEGWWVRGYGPEGAPNIDLREKLPLLNQKIMELTPSLFDGSYSIGISGQRQLKSDKRIKNEISLDLQGKFSRCSHSEKQKINTIIQIALGSLYGVSCNCLFFDEFFSGLDSAGIEAATGLFRELLGSYKGLESIFVISHADVADFDDEIVFEKIDGVTYLRNN